MNVLTLFKHLNVCRIYKEHILDVVKINNKATVLLNQTIFEWYMLNVFWLKLNNGWLYVAWGVQNCE